MPDPTSVWDYNRLAYGRLNPLKYNDPTGHCSTLEDGSPDFNGDTQCWQTAYAIYGYGAGGFAAFQEDWKVSADDWLENIAKQSFATTEYLQPFHNKYYSLWKASVGLSHYTPFVKLGFVHKRCPHNSRQCQTALSGPNNVLPPIVSILPHCAPLRILHTHDTMTTYTALC